MLVLSRRPSEKIVFPALGVTLQVLETRGNAVKIGIEAPPDVKVLREELAGAAEAAARPARSPLHALRNRLNKLGLSLHLFDRQWRAEMTAEAGATLERVFELLDGLEQECAAAEGGRPPARPAPRPKVRSLVVEDDRNERELLAGLLRMNGCECETAADGLEALDYLASHERPDVVLLDLRMPRCDGQETLARIRRDPRYAGLKVFVVSGTPPQEAGIRTSGPDGVDGWFPKPLNPRKLWDAIQDSLSAPGAKN
jgi:carbon storage regulator CsrA